MDASSSNVERAQQQQQQPRSAYAGCLTPESKEKGDAGIYAAMDAMQLSRVLHGATDSRLDTSRQQGGSASAATAAGGGVAGARANGASSNSNNMGSGSGSGGGNTVQLGVEPEVFRHGATAAVHAIFADAMAEAVQPAPGDAYLSARTVKAVVKRGIEGGLSGTSSTAVGLLQETESLEQVLPLVHELKPRDAVDYDALRRLFTLMEAAAGSSGADGTGITTVLLARGVVDPARQPAPSTAAWEAMYNELQGRYPLPTAPSARDGDDEQDEEEGEGGAEEDQQHNAALQERCSALHIPYKTYKQALRDVAACEMRVFPLLCGYLSHNDACRQRGVSRANVGGDDASAHSSTRHRAAANVKVLNLAGNRLGAAAAAPADQEGGAPVRQLAPLRALAALIDANESLRYLNLRNNALGPRGVGIVAKALTKNIALTGIDLSANQLSGAAAGEEVEDVEDPLYEEEDPVFGEPLEGLDALAEVLKKNKFLRVLRLGENGLHAGEDLTGAPPPDEEEGDRELEEAEEAEEAKGPHNGSDGSSSKAWKGLSVAEAQERWQGVPLWNLLTPLHRYHRLRVLDLSKNLLGNTGAQMVAVAVAHNHSIEVLDLTDNAIGFSGLNFLSRYLFMTPLPAPTTTSSSSPSLLCATQGQQDHHCALHTLILRQNPLSCVGGAADAATGVDARRRRLTTRQQRQASRAIENFAAGLQRHGRLRRLVLANTYLGPAASAVVLRALARVPTLEELDFSFNNACGEHVATFDATAVPHLASLLFSGAASPPSALQRLCFDGNNLTAAGLAVALQQPATAESGAAVLTPTLRELTLSRNSLGNALAPLAAVLTASNVARLDLSYNDISSMASLVRDLRDGPPAAALEDLNLSHNKLGVQEEGQRGVAAVQRQEEEVGEFFHCLAQMPHLAVVDLSYNDWRPVHVEQLSAVLADPSRAQSLRKLDVRHTPRVPAAPLMTLFHAVAVRPIMEVFAASVPLDEAENGGAWTFEAVIAAIHAVVCASASLVEVDCGLHPGNAAAARGSEATTQTASAAQATEAQITQIRERLLLNALMAAASLRAE